MLFFLSLWNIQISFFLEKQNKQLNNKITNLRYLALLNKKLKHIIPKFKCKKYSSLLKISAEELLIKLNTIMDSVLQFHKAAYLIIDQTILLNVEQYYLPNACVIKSTKIFIRKTKMQFNLLYNNLYDICFLSILI